MKYSVFTVLLISTLFLIGCIQPKYGINAYDEKNNITNYYLISYGGLVIPGKWNRDTHEKNSAQYSLIGPDSTNRLFVQVFKPRRSFLGFSPYTDSYNYLKSEISLSQDKGREEDDLLGDSTSTFEIIEKDSINNFIVSRYVRKRRRLTIQAVILNGIRKKMFMNFSITTSKVDSINNPRIWDVATQKDFLKKVFLMN